MKGLHIRLRATTCFDGSAAFDFWAFSQEIEANYGRG